MNWDAVGAIAELFAAIGALAALIYLALQLRHNTEALRKASSQPDRQLAFKELTLGQN